ncbi:acyltransferase family protein [Paludisphaera mucosa]|uniref:Acyltransferase family protein n=1 Tax=Paludisphaera mucosa TaxID=3030827 RepID=A0ABT6FIB6_9BACT|nr:acyltransferase family protein [Paludisphaera mucosa]MDG3007295.1 acyltransferase family protein [Paludisphaera mucosa]
MSTHNTMIDRRSDLDALRAGAMLLGIALHASLSFFPAYWVVSDRSQEPAFGLLFSAVHGFRMPLFFVMSGYFSAMLLHRRGRAALVEHRFRRVFLPLLAGMVTIVPLTMGISTLAMTSAPRKAGGTAPAAGASTIWTAARSGDLDAVELHLKNGAAVDAFDPDRGGTPMMWAAVAGRAEAVQRLIDRGADVNAAGRDGGTALHGAAFLGHERTVDVLIRNGADLNVANKDGSTPLDTAVLDEGTTRYFASVLQLDLDENDLGRRKAAIAETLRHHGATAGRKSGLADILMQMPLFNHLWFLWFLWWLVLGLAAVSALGSRLPTIQPPAWMARSPGRYLWLIPLTMIPQWFMGDGGDPPFFGPDTSSGLLPIPHVLAYYAVFFGFGALDFGVDDRTGRVDERWWLPLAIGLLVVFPLGTALNAGWAGPPGFALDPSARRLLSVFLQAAYPWLITFGLMGLFRRICPVESPTMRYLSDSAYWLYLAHLPLIIGAQYVVRDWPLPAAAKFLLVVAASTALLLLSYQTLVRYTWIGRLLNGPRVRPAAGSEGLAVPAQ